VLNNFSFVTRPAKPPIFERLLPEERDLKRIRKMLARQASPSKDDPAIWPMRTRFRHLPLTIFREPRLLQSDDIAIEQFDRLHAQLAQSPGTVTSLAIIEEVFLTGNYIAFHHYIA